MNLDFENIYTATGSAEIGGTKTMNVWAKDAEFEVVLSAITKDAPVPPNLKATLTEDKPDFTFAFKYDENDINKTYLYKVEETAGENIAID